jgi:hypothetical protein
LSLVSVHERKTGDHVIVSIESRRYEVLRVVTKEFKDRKHSKTTMLEFLKSTLLFFSLEVGLSNIEISEPSADINGSNEENNLCPSKSRDCVDSGNSIWYISACDSGGDVESPAEELRDNVSNNSELSDTAI